MSGRFSVIPAHAGIPLFLEAARDNERGNPVAAGLTAVAESLL